MALVRDSLQEDIEAALAAYQARLAEIEGALKIALLKPETVVAGMTAYNEAFKLAAVTLQNDMTMAQATFFTKVTQEIGALRKSVANEAPPYQG